MGLFGAILNEARNARRLGPTVVLRRHLSRFTSSERFSVRLEGYGRIFMRPNDSDFEVVRMVLAGGDYDVDWPPEMGARIDRRYQEILSAGKRPIVIDAGSNIGASSLRFGRMWPEATIVSVEPDPGNLELLRLNVADRPNHVIVDAAIGSAPGRVALKYPGESWAVQTDRADQGTRIVTIDDALTAAGEGEPFLCNIDIEGFEADLFSTNTGWVDRFCVIYIEPHDWTRPGAHLSQNFQNVMASHSFEIFLHNGRICYLHL